MTKLPNETTTTFNAEQPQSDVPAAALCLDAEVELGERPNDDTKTAPIRMRARTGDSIDHWYWGKVAHDLDGFELTGNKNRLAILFEHSEPIGYALRKNISTDSGDLELNATLVETRNSNRATDVIDWMSAGIPFESSISFAGNDTQVEVVREGQFTTVNSKRFEGPGVIFRKWKLREVSVVTSGADDDTESSLLSNSDSVSVNYVTPNEEDKEMSQENTENVEAQAVDTQTVDDSSEAAAVDTQPTAAVEGQPNMDRPEEELRELGLLSAGAASGQDFMDAFGEQRGAVYFAKGMNFGTALVQEMKRLQEQNAELLSRIDKQANDGADEPLHFGENTAEPKKGHNAKGELTEIPISIGVE